MYTQIIQTTDIYEAAYYLLYGGEIQEVLIAKVPEHKQKKKGYRKEITVTMTGVPLWAKDGWDSDHVFGPISEYAKARKKLKRLLYRLLNKIYL